jgi:hypothetical protein
LSERKRGECAQEPDVPLSKPSERSAARWYFEIVSQKCCSQDFLSAPLCTRILPNSSTFSFILIEHLHDSESYSLFRPSALHDDSIPCPFEPRPCFSANTVSGRTSLHPSDRFSIETLRHARTRSRFDIGCSGGFLCEPVLFS